MGPSVRSRTKRRAGKEWWEKTETNDDIQIEAKKTGRWFLILTFSFVPCFISFLLTYSYLERGKVMFVEALHLKLIGEGVEDLGENVTENNADMDKICDDKSDE